MICDHTKEYSIYTRVAGYSRTRIYHCQVCNSQMAMDSLPQHLIKRMFGDVVQEKTRELVPVDLCIVFSGLIAPLLSRIFIWYVYVYKMKCHII